MKLKEKTTIVTIIKFILKDFNSNEETLIKERV